MNLTSPPQANSFNSLLVTEDLERTKLVLKCNKFEVLSPFLYELDMSNIHISSNVSTFVLCTIFTSSDEIPMAQ